MRENIYGLGKYIRSGKIYTEWENIYTEWENIFGPQALSSSILKVDGGALGAAARTATAGALGRWGGWRLPPGPALA